MWKIVRGIKYWCDPMCLILHFAVRVQVLSGSISQKYTSRKVPDLQKSVFDVLWKRKSFSFLLLSILLPCMVSIIQYYACKNLITVAALSSRLSFPLLHTCVSQVGIHHHVGGRLTSDSFVNVNYCGLSEPRESGTCRAVRRWLRRTQNNRPMCLWFPHPSSTSALFTHPNMQI